MGNFIGLIASRNGGIVLACAIGILASAQADADDYSAAFPFWRINVFASGGLGAPGRVASGDLNGDGFADVIIGTNGAPASLESGSTSGAVLVLFGNASRHSTISTPVVGTPERDELHIVSQKRPEFAPLFRDIGEAVASDDFNGDGLDDVVFSGVFNTLYQGNPQSEGYLLTLNILYGAQCLRSATADLQNPGGCQSLSQIVLDDAAYDGMGSICTGDFNADGFSDIAATAVHDLDDADVLILFGPFSSSRVSLLHDSFADTPARVLLDRNRPLEGDYYPRHVKPVVNLQTGDLNGDGIDDIVIGDPMSDPDGGIPTFPEPGLEGQRIGSTGRITTVFGASSLPGRVIEIDDPAGTNGEAQIWGESFPAQLGQTIAIADTNCDGFDDLAAGATSTPAGFIAGQSGMFGLLVYGSNGLPGTPTGSGSLIDTAVHSATGNFGETRLTWQPAIGEQSVRHGKLGLGDADGDGRADVLVSELSSTGPDEVAGLTIHPSLPEVDGGPVFPVGELDFDSETSQDPGLECSAAEGLFAEQQLCQQDVDRDGFADLIVSANAPASALFVYFAGSSTPTAKAVERLAAGGSGQRGAGGRLSPVSRAWIQFEDGGASEATVTTIRSNAGITGMPQNYSGVAKTYWRIDSDRTGWTSAKVSFRYTDTDLVGIHEDGLELITAPTPSGPWTRVTSQARNTRANKISGTVNTLGYFALAFDQAVYLNGCPYVSEILCQSTGNSSIRVDTMTVIFTLPVTGVDASDFRVIAPSNEPGAILTVDGSGDTYRVRIMYNTGVGSATFTVLDNDSIRDEGNRPLGGNGAANGSVSQQTCGVLNVPPSVTGIVRNYPSPNALQHVSYKVTFSVPVSGVDVSDFALDTVALDGVHVERVEGSGATYHVWINTGTGSGTLSLRLDDDDTIEDATGTPLGGNGEANGNFQGDAYGIERGVADTLPPSVASITRASVSPTSAVSVNYYVAFSEDVIGVDESDFALVTSSHINGAEITEVQSDSLVAIVKISTGTGDGTIQLRLVDNDSIADLAGNVLGGAGAGNGSYLNGPLYTIYKSDPNELPPTVTSITRLDPSPTEAFSVRYRVLFDENVAGVDATDFVTTVEGLIGSGVTNVNGSGDDYTVTVNTGNGVGTLRLDVRDNDSILDADHNPLGGIGSDNGHFTGGQYYQIVRDPFLSVRPLKKGAEVDRGERVNVKWTSGDVGKNVRIELWRNGQRITVLDKKAKNDGAQKVTIPGGISAGSGYTIRVVSTSNANHYTDMKKPFSVQ